MDGDSDSSLWQKLTRLFNNKDVDHVEQAIIEASEEGEIDAEESSMLLRVLHLDDLQVQDIMTPRTDIFGIEAAKTIFQAIEIIVGSGHSRIPIYQENRDNIVGIVYAKDLLREALHSEKMQAPVTNIMRSPFFVPETKNVLELLQEFRMRKTHLAVIFDEYGGTSGIVTIEDVLEQIVGEIEDEHDAPREEEIRLQDDGSAILSGRAYLDDINDTLNIDIDSDEVDTIGGHISHIIGRVPLNGETFTIANRVFKVLEADAKQIHSILVESVESSNANSGKPGDSGGMANGNAPDNAV